ncbi:MAG: hypothetical protein ACPHID_06300 [Thermoplasmatota archaeon]
MGRAIAILGIIGSVFAALAATIFVDPVTLLPALYALGAGIFLSISRDWRRWVPGATAILFSILGMMGIIGYIGGENSGVDLMISVPFGKAFVVAACLEIAGASILLSREEAEPAWLPWIPIGAWGLAFLAAMFARDALGDQSQAMSLVIALLALVTITGPILHLRDS